ncbi:MAG: hypothetical protein N2314_07660 [Brevinematales bacterium]|nr:hypothetical protein [Brevinematales bacterium]
MISSVTFLWFLVVFFSLIIAWQDCVFQRFSLFLALSIGLFLILLSYVSDVPSLEWWIERVGGGILPASVLVMGALKKKAGWGDGVIAFFCGWYVGVFHIGWWLLFSLLPAWAHVIVLHLTKEKNPRIPFVTWMIVGFWVWKGCSQLGVLPF